MTRLHTSQTNYETNTADPHSADPKMVWSFTWEFDWSPAAAATAHTLRVTVPRTGADELGHMLDKALAYAG